MNKRKIIAIVLIVIILSTPLIGLVVYHLTCGRKIDNDGYYLFCYFVGNEPNQERVHLAISDNGYDFTPLNDNKEIIIQNLGKKACRDPFIFRAFGKYYIIATDMRASEGWTSNHAMVVWESEDLVNWTNERIIDLHDYEGFEKSNRVWAPQVIFDEKAGKYMIYFSHSFSEGDDLRTYIWYAYTSDFVTIETPKPLFAPKSGKDAIDADIIYENGKYYLYYKDENQSTICYAQADELLGEYVGEKKVAKVDIGMEGNCMYKLVGTDTYLMILDMYKRDRYYMQTTTASDMTSFKKVAIYDYSFDFDPRHGSILTISKQEYDFLKTAKFNIEA